MNPAATDEPARTEAKRFSDLQAAYALQGRELLRIDSRDGGQLVVGRFGRLQLLPSLEAAAQHLAQIKAGAA